MRASKRFGTYVLHKRVLHLLRESIFKTPVLCETSYTGVII